MLPANLLKTLHQPEIRLASRISATVLLLLFSVVALAAVFAETADDNRKSEFFQMRESSLSRRPMMLKNFAELPMKELGNHLGERRALPANLRNLAIVFPSGEIEILGSLEGADVLRSFDHLPERRMEKRHVGDEEYVFYAFPAGDRTIVLYEDEEMLEGAKTEMLLSFSFGIVLFSLLLFFVSFKIAKKVIEPIKRLAERERAYARHIAHELKTPLAVAKSDLELALAIPKEKNDRIRSAVEEISSMRSTVDDLLLLSLSEGGISKETVDLNECVTAEIERFAANDPVEWSVLSAAGEGKVEISADPRLLKTLLRNLITNVRVHALPGTKATVSVSKTELVFKNRPSEAPKKRGKSPFEAFEWTPGKGSGIGLSLVKRICELHGWNISFTTHDGEVVVTTVF